MLTLRSTFEQLQPSLDAVLDGLHVAHFKMQSRDELARSPVTPVETVIPNDIQGASNVNAIPFSQYEHQNVWTLRMQPLEEFETQVWCGPMFTIGSLIAGVEEAQMI